LFYAIAINESVLSHGLSGVTMWSSENQRLGANKAYHLESWGDSFNVSSIQLFILSLILAPLLSYFYGWSFMFLIIVPVFLFIIGAVMRGSSETILKELGFIYDYLITHESQPL